MAILRRLFYLALLLLGLFALLWIYIESDPGGSTPDERADVSTEVSIEVSTEVPTFIGSPARPQPVSAALANPLIQHPFLAPAGVNSMHNDAAQSDAYRWAGPTGNELQVSTRQFHRITGSCVAQTFDSVGHMIGTCVSPFGVTLVARDPVSLEILARQSITRWLPIGQKFSGGVYFHLDHEDRVLLASNDLNIERWALEKNNSDYRWVREQQIDIGETLNALRREDHKVIDVMPDWQGNYWFITRAGLVGTIDRDGSNGRAIALAHDGVQEGIDNALAVGENGVFVVSSHAMYSFQRDTNDGIEQRWRETYLRSDQPKQGTMGHGSGTTPTLLGNDYVAITDSADGQIHVVVYAQQPREGAQEVCKQAVFPADRGASENSLAVVGDALIVENNFGYSGPKNTPNAEPGLARVNIIADGVANQSRCELAWENRTLSSPSAVPKVSLANGLVYVYTRDDSNPDDLHAWYFTAVDIETGEVAFKQLTGVGWLFNNHYGSISISPDGAAYVGIMGGLVKIVDGS